MGESPKGLDETYEHTLRVIHEKEREYAHRIFQCLTVSSRPLRIEEVAEIFTFEVDAESGVILKFNADWRPKDAEEAVLFACSSLVVVVKGDWERTVQFSHTSVQQFLTSDRVANSKEISNFHVLLESAHTFLARACLSLLLDDSDHTSSVHKSPLHSYAVKHWVDHARFGRVSSIIYREMIRLFDKSRPHYFAWIRAYDMEGLRNLPMPLGYPVPVYYAALCGFCDLADELLFTHPQDINARGGLRVTPLHAALDNGHIDVARLLLPRWMF